MQGAAQRRGRQGRVAGKAVKTAQVKGNKWTQRLMRLPKYENDQLFRSVVKKLAELFDRTFELGEGSQVKLEEINIKLTASLQKTRERLTEVRTGTNRVMILAKCPDCDGTDKDCDWCHERNFMVKENQKYYLQQG